MSYKIGKLKTVQTNMIEVGGSANPTFVSVNGALDVNLYDDITSIENWLLYGDLLCTDILQVRDRVKEILDVSGWTGLTNTEKDVVITLFLKESNKADNVSDTEKVMYLMSRGYSLAEAQSRLMQAYGDYHVKEIHACANRANSEKLYIAIAKYLSLTDASDLIKITHKLFDLYKSQAIRGTLDGNAGEGLFNFLESTVGTSFETTGLTQQGYILKTGTYASFITELMDILRHGNY
jgi:hypothetical protein